VHIMIRVVIALQIHDLVLLLSMLIFPDIDLEVFYFISFRNIQSSFVLQTVILGLHSHLFCL